MMVTLERGFAEVMNAVSMYSKSLTQSQPAKLSEEGKEEIKVNLKKIYKKQIAETNDTFVKNVSVGTSTGLLLGAVATRTPVGAIAGALIGSGLASLKNASDRSDSENPFDRSKGNTLASVVVGLAASAQEILSKKAPTNIGKVFLLPLATVGVFALGSSTAKVISETAQGIFHRKQS